MLGGPQEVFVVYSTTDYREQSVVRYGELSGQLFSEALGTKRTYTQRICPEPLAHLNPMPGPPANELDLSTAMKLQNTSQWLPRDSSAYRVVNNESDVVQGCWPYMNENAFYESPIIHTVRLTNLKPSTMYYYSCGSSQSRSELYVAVFLLEPDAHDQPSRLLRRGLSGQRILL